MRKVKGTENEDDMGTKDLDGPTHLRMFSAQVMIATLVAFVTCVIWNALRQVRLFNTTVPVRTVERGTQSELNPVDSLVTPTNVYCSPGGECYHT